MINCPLLYGHMLQEFMSIKIAYDKVCFTLGWERERDTEINDDPHIAFPCP